MGLKQFFATRPEASFRTVAVETMREKHVDVFVVGSSHIYTAIDPSRFSSTLVNLADSALDYRMAEVLCQKYWARVSKSEVVVLELDAVPVYQDTVARRNGDYGNFYEWDLSANDLPISSYQKIKARIVERFAITRHGRLWPTIAKQAPQIDDHTGAGFHSRKGKINPADKELFFAELGTEFNEHVVEANLEAFIRLVTRLNESGVKVMLLQPPFHPDYWEHPSSELRKQYAERALSRFLALPFGSEASIIDMRLQTDLTDDDFADWTHLSRSGSRRISERLAQHLAKASS